MKLARDNMNTQEQLAELIKEYRDQCLWFLRADYFPETPEESRSVLNLIARYGNRDAFTRAQMIKSWLSHDSRATS